MSGLSQFRALDPMLNPLAPVRHVRFELPEEGPALDVGHIIGGAWLEDGLAWLTARRDATSARRRLAREMEALDRVK